MYLNEIELGKKCKIKKINLEDNIKRRMLDIGLIDGVEIECVLQSPFKEPKAYLIRNAIICIRNNDAKNIEVDLL